MHTRDHTRTPFRRLLWDWASVQHKAWNGFSLGPGLRRTDLVRALGPMEAFASELYAQPAFASRYSLNPST